MLTSGVREVTLPRSPGRQEALGLSWPSLLLESCYRPELSPGLADQFREGHWEMALPSPIDSELLFPSPFPSRANSFRETTCSTRDVPEIVILLSVHHWDTSELVNQRLKW